MTAKQYLKALRAQPSGVETTYRRDTAVMFVTRNGARVTYRQGEPGGMNYTVDAPWLADAMSDGQAEYGDWKQGN